MQIQGTMLYKATAATKTNAPRQAALIMMNDGITIDPLLGLKGARPDEEAIGMPPVPAAGAAVVAAAGTPPSMIALDEAEDEAEDMTAEDAAAAPPASTEELMEPKEKGSMEAVAIMEVAAMDEDAGADDEAEAEAEAEAEDWSSELPPSWLRRCSIQSVAT